MKDLDVELWKLGILAKTEHNEVAPSQHELAPIFTTTNVATDHNQLTMEIMKKVADHHGLACLLHEKPFAGVNGSGKHNNWSISTDTGVNLLEPGNSPYENAQFLLFLSAVIKAVNDYQDLLRVSVASAANDHRLGANEAPPAIVSMFLGDELTDILNSLEAGSIYDKKEKVEIEIGVDVLPRFPKDTTDRNRTSPFAFTGNKFEFRMLGSSFSIADSNIYLNTGVAEILSQFADLLEKAPDFTIALNELIKTTIRENKRIIFNGNNYSDEWVKEAEKRGLLNLKSTPDALPYLINEKNIALFMKHKVFTETEIHSRYEILLENYCKVLNIESLTMLDMVKKDIIPSVCSYIKDLSETAIAKKQAISDINCEVEESLIKKLSNLSACLYNKAQQLDNEILNSKNCTDTLESAKYYRENIFTSMQELRAVADEIETFLSKNYLPYPTYGDLLFSV
jgi:glutamine synthetase